MRTLRRSPRSTRAPSTLDELRRPAPARPRSTAWSATVAREQVDLALERRRHLARVADVEEAPARALGDRVERALVVVEADAERRHLRPEREAAARASSPSASGDDGPTLAWPSEIITMRRTGWSRRADLRDVRLGELEPLEHVRRAAGAELRRRARGRARASRGVSRTGGDERRARDR